MVKVFKELSKHAVLFGTSKRTSTFKPTSIESTFYQRKPRVSSLSRLDSESKQHIHENLELGNGLRTPLHFPGSTLLNCIWTNHSHGVDLVWFCHQLESHSRYCLHLLLKRQADDRSSHRSFQSKEILPEELVHCWSGGSTAFLTHWSLVERALPQTSEITSSSETGLNHEIRLHG